MWDGPCLHLDFFRLDFIFSPSLLGDMSLSKGDSHPVSHILGLLGPEEPFQCRPKFLDQEDEESPFKIVYRTSWFALALTPTPIVALVPIQAFASLVGVASIVSKATILHLQRIYGILDYIRFFALDPSDRVISSLKRGIAFYEAFLYAGLYLPFHPFILTLLDWYCLVLARLTLYSF